VDGRPTTVTGRISPVGWRPSGSNPGLWVGQAYLTDDHGDSVELIWFARAPAGRRRPARFPVHVVPGQRVAASGRPERVLPHGWRIRQPVLEPVGGTAAAATSADAAFPAGGSLHTGRLVPEYPLTEGLTQRVMRRIVYQALAHVAGRVPDPLPASLLRAADLLPKEQALRWLHFPGDPAGLARARRRLAFEELLLLRLASGLRRRQGGRRSGWPLPPAGAAVQEWLRQLPFVPTAAQRRTMAEMEAELVQRRPMQRLLQGDVGSGKTLVAAYALLRAAEHGLQAALLAPSDILAQQHAATLSRWFEPLGISVRL